MLGRPNRRKPPSPLLGCVAFVPEKTIASSRKSASNRVGGKCSRNPYSFANRFGPAVFLKSSGAFSQFIFAFPSTMSGRTMCTRRRHRRRLYSIAWMLVKRASRPLCFIDHLQAARESNGGTLEIGALGQENSWIPAITFSRHYFYFTPLPLF